MRCIFAVFKSSAYPVVEDVDLALVPGGGQPPALRVRERDLEAVVRDGSAGAGHPLGRAGGLLFQHGAHGHLACGPVRAHVREGTQDVGRRDFQGLLPREELPAGRGEAERDGARHAQAQPSLQVRLVVDPAHVLREVVAHRDLELGRAYGGVSVWSATEGESIFTYGRTSRRPCGSPRPPP